MMNIATLTMNPTIDVSFETDRVFHTRKMRGRNECHAPGGGGINVARVFVRLGGNARCYYLSGGATGAALDGLIDLHQLVRSRIAIAGETRVSTSVYERGSGHEYRFVTEGPTVSPGEWQDCLDRIGEVRCDYLVVSGSLPRGVPEDFYAQVADRANERDIRVVLDSSGRGLAGGLAGRGIYLVKPSIGELRSLTGRDLASDETIAEAAKEIVDRGEAEHVAVTMGRDGGLLCNASGVRRLPAVPIKAASTVGAGDSFLAAMVHSLASGQAPGDAFRFGLAAGAAAALTPGTDLAQPDEIRRLFADSGASSAR